VLASGSGHNNSGQPQGDPKEWAKSFNPPSWASGIGRLLAPRSPKLKLDQTNIEFGAVHFTVGVLPDTNHSFRNAVFQITKGCMSIGPDQKPRDCSNVKIQYHDPVQEGPSPDLRDQTWQGLAKTPDQGSLMILQSGGTLTFWCEVVASCKAVLQ